MQYASSLLLVPILLHLSCHYLSLFPNHSLVMIPLPPHPLTLLYPPNPYRITGPILEFLDEWGTENLDMVDIREIANPKTTKVFVNGNWVGVHRDPEDLISESTDLTQYPLFVFICAVCFCWRI